jgi:hypothetical protein
MRKIVVGLLLFTLFVPGCDDGTSEGGQGESCYQDGTCTDGLICENDICSSNNINNTNSSNNTSNQTHETGWEVCESQNNQEDCQALGCIYRLTHFGLVEELSCTVTAEFQHSCIAQITLPEENAPCSYFRNTTDGTIVMGLDSCTRLIDGWKKCVDSFPSGDKNCNCDFP